MASTLRANIAELTERRRREASAASLGARIADRVTRFAGSMRFVAVHGVVYGSWIAWNAVPGLRHFDPSFVVLAMVASVEAIFLSTFILISQNRMSAAETARADLNLHITLLTEHEITKLAQLVDRIAARLDVAHPDPGFQEVKQVVDPAKVLDALEETGADEAS
jgi:uncharacterized membrane protein